LNGSGYPFGLSERHTIVEARILAVADVVEAMATHRPYRPALGIDSAMAEISRNKGILYAPDITDAVLRLFHDKKLNIDTP
jgi:putative two-component system response regulator